MKDIKPILEGIYSNLELRQSIVPLFIGNPGISKSVQIREFAKEKGVKLVPFITSQRNPFEISGLAMPNRDTKKMEYWDFDTLLNMEDGDILFFDELLNGNAVTLNACLTILEERELISGKELPKIMIVAAANPQQMTPASPQIKERFVWYEFDFPKESWQDFMAKKYKMPPVVSTKLCKLILEEEFKKKSNYFSARSIDKAVGMIINDVETPYKPHLEIHLNTIIENKLKERVQLNDDISLEPGEKIGWLDMVQISKGIKAPDKDVVESKGYWRVLFMDSNGHKLHAVKQIKELTGLGLAEAKRIVDAAPGSIITEGLNRTDAARMNGKLKQDGFESRIEEYFN